MCGATLSRLSDFDKNIVLVGFMGTGKSAVGRLLADRLKRPFVDLDGEIERTTGMSIPQIFAQYGEAEFRRLEKESVSRIATLKGHVIATGGGVVMDEENVQLLKSSGILICLTATPDAILQRILPTRSSRPLLLRGDPKERIAELMALRASYYAKADVTIDTTHRRPEEVAEEIIRSVGRIHG